MRAVTALAIALAIVGGSCCTSVEARDAKVIREFKREVPCPATGKRRGNCPSFQADHIVPLCAGGLDHWSNLQWLVVRQHKEKTIKDKKGEKKVVKCWGLLRCKNEKCQMIHNRDKNSALNMSKIVKNILNGLGRPKEYCKKALPLSKPIK